MAESMTDFTTLIVEDEAVMAMDLQRRLRKLGYAESVVKGSSDAALMYLEVHNPNLILCDISIDGDKDGIDVAEYVMEHKSIPLIFVSALSDKGTLERAKKTLPYGYIVKPFKNRDLATAIEMALYKYSIDVDRLKLSIDKVNKIAITPLSQREYEILEGVLKGQTNSQLSEANFVSVSTIKYHISNLLSKLDVKNRASISSRVLSIFT